MHETDLYAPVKSFLVRLGFEVKAEVKGCDVVARRSDGGLLVVEMKLGLTLQLIYQAIDRLSLTELVYIAVARGKRGVPAEAVKLCRRLGLGLMVVSPSGSIDILAEPEPYRPRPNARRKAALLRELAKRRGDPNTGGSTGAKLITAYKQDALRCLAFLKYNGPSKVACIRAATQVERTASILRSDYYGWFTRQARGIYELTPAGLDAEKSFAAQIAALA
jgi:hypothetical protein